MPSITPFLLQFAKEPRNFSAQGRTSKSANSLSNASDSRSHKPSLERPRPGTIFTEVNHETTDDR